MDRPSNQPTDLDLALRQLIAKHPELRQHFNSVIENEEHPAESDMDAWVYRLKAGFEAGYYRTEPAEDAQTSFPWQNKTCHDCPFWAHSICQVFAEYRTSSSHTCAYYDPWNRARAQTIIRARQSQGFLRWWQWFSDRGSTR